MDWRSTDGHKAGKGKGKGKTEGGRYRELKGFKSVTLD